MEFITLYRRFDDIPLATQKGHLSGTFVQMDAVNYSNRIALENLHPPLGKKAGEPDDQVLFNDINPLYDCVDDLDLKLYKTTGTQFMPSPHNIYDSPAAALMSTQLATTQIENPTLETTANWSAAETPDIYESLEDALQEPSSKTVAHVDNKGFRTEPASGQAHTAETAFNGKGFNMGVTMEDPGSMLYDSLDAAVHADLETAAPAFNVRARGTNSGSVMMDEPMLYDSLDAVTHRENEGTVVPGPPIKGVELPEEPGLYDSLDAMVDKKSDATAYPAGRSVELDQGAGHDAADFDAGAMYNTLEGTLSDPVAEPSNPESMNSIYR